MLSSQCHRASEYGLTVPRQAPGPSPSWAGHRRLAAPRTPSALQEDTSLSLPVD